MEAGQGQGWCGAVRCAGTPPGGCGWERRRSGVSGARPRRSARGGVGDDAVGMGGGAPRRASGWEAARPGSFSRPFHAPLCFPKPGCSFLFLVCVWGGERPRQRVPPFCCVPGAPTPSQAIPAFKQPRPHRGAGRPLAQATSRAGVSLFCFVFVLICFVCGVGGPRAPSQRSPRARTPGDPAGVGRCRERNSVRSNTHLHTKERLRRAARGQGEGGGSNVAVHGQARHGQGRCLRVSRNPRECVCDHAPAVLSGRLGSRG